MFLFYFLSYFPSFFSSLSLSPSPSLLSFSVFLSLSLCSFSFYFALGRFPQLYLPAFLLSFFFPAIIYIYIFFISKTSLLFSDYSFLIAFCSCFEIFLCSPNFVTPPWSVLLFHIATFLNIVGFFGCLFIFKNKGLTIAWSAFSLPLPFIHE